MVKLVIGIAVAASLAAQTGKDTGVERTSYIDPVSKVRVWEMTSAVADASNLYYHVSNFTADNKYVIFSRNNQIFRYEVATGRIVQLTEGANVSSASACPDHTNARRIYFMRGPDVMALDIVDFTSRKVGAIPEPRAGGYQQPTLNGDGSLLAVTKKRDGANWEIGTMRVSDGQYKTVVTQGFQIGHVQYSPTLPMIFYVWETGGYAPQRSWVVNADGTANRPFYARPDQKTWFTPLKEWMTHESWVMASGDMTMIMDKIGVILVKPDGTSRMVKEGNFWHVNARPDGRFMVMDDFDGRLWLLETETGNLRLLATGLRERERSVHAHASFDRQGRYVLFNSGRTHKGLCMIDLNDVK